MRYLEALIAAMLLHSGVNGALAGTPPLVLDFDQPGNTKPVRIAVPSDGDVSFDLIKTKNDPLPAITVEVTAFRDESGAYLSGPVTVRRKIEGGTLPFGMSADRAIEPLVLHVLQPPRLVPYTGKVIVLATGFDPIVSTLELNWSASLATRRCDYFKELAAAGRADDARKLYEVRSVSGTDPPCDDDVRRTLFQLSGRGYSKAAALNELGLVDRAWATLDADVTAGQLDDEARKQWGIVLASPWGWIVRASAWFNVYVTKAAAALAPLAAMCLGIAALVAGAVGLHKRKQSVLEIGDFDGSVGGVTPNALLKARIETNLLRMGKVNRLGGTEVIAGPVQVLDLPTDLGSAPKDVTAIVGLINKFFPPNVVQLTGVLETDVTKGVGLTLRLVHQSSQRVWGSSTLWSQDFCSVDNVAAAVPDVEQYLRLTDAAAIWTYWQLWQHGDGSDLDLRRAFGTANWESYVLFRASSQTAKSSDTQTKRRFLQRAIIKDPLNRSAIVNLVKMQGATSPDPSVDKQLAAVIAFSKALEVPHDPVFVMANHLLGIRALHHYDIDRKNGALLQAALTALDESLRATLTERERSDDDQSEPWKEPVIKWLEWAVKRAEKTATAYAKTPPTPEDSPAITNDLRDSVAITLADATWLLAWHDWHERAAELPALSCSLKSISHTLLAPTETKLLLPPLAEWNLACHYSNAVQLGAVAKGDVDTYLDKALKHLTASIDFEPSWKNDILTDPSLDALRTQRAVAVEALLDT